MGYLEHIGAILPRRRGQEGRAPDQKALLSDYLADSMGKDQHSLTRTAAVIIFAFQRATNEQKYALL